VLKTAQNGSITTKEEHLVDDNKLSVDKDTMQTGDMSKGVSKYLPYTIGVTQ